VKREQQVLDTIRQFYVYCETREAKFEAIRNLYEAITIGQAMIFCHVRLTRLCRWNKTVQTRAASKYLHGQMSELGHRCALLIGDLSIDERARVINEFKEQKYRVLISTNVTARGNGRTSRPLTSHALLQALTLSRCRWWSTMIYRS
jgi:ATP-dependent RNA helicase DDX19/DBP5